MGEGEGEGGRIRYGRQESFVPSRYRRRKRKETRRLERPPGERAVRKVPVQVPSRSLVRKESKVKVPGYSVLALIYLTLPAPTNKV